MYVNESMHCDISFHVLAYAYHLIVGRLTRIILILISYLLASYAYIGFKKPITNL